MRYRDFVSNKENSAHKTGLRSSSVSVADKVTYSDKQSEYSSPFKNHHQMMQ